MTVDARALTPRHLQNVTLIIDNPLKRGTILILNFYRRQKSNTDLSIIDENVPFSHQLFLKNTFVHQ